MRAAIRRPVATTMVYVCVAVLGVAAWNNIPVEFLPDTTLPQLGISAHWPGAGSSEVVEAFLTSPLEGLVQQLKGVQNVTSQSDEDAATLSVTFVRGTDMNLVRLALSERLAALRRDLPNNVSFNITQPEARAIAVQRRPFLSYDVTGPYTLDHLYERVEDVVATEIRKILGVSAVSVTGGRRRVLEIVIDENRANSLGVTPQQVASAINGLQLVQQLGTVTQRGLQLPLTVRDRPTNIEEIFDALVLVGNNLIRVRDVVSTIHDTYADPTSHYRINGNPAVNMTVSRAPGTNLLAVSDAVKARIAELEPLLPPGTRLIMRSDESVHVREQLGDLRRRAIGSAVVIALVLLVFVRSIRSTAIIFSTIAFSVLLTLNLVYWAGISLNALTIMGIAMGFGMVVDNAIVVLENVYRRRRLGEPAEYAAEHGTREVVLPILAATLTTVVVLVPFVYMQGNLALYYIPLAFVVGFSLLASLFVAFTFIPAVAARMLRRPLKGEESGGSGESALVPAVSVGDSFANIGGGTADARRTAPPAARAAHAPYASGTKQPLYIRFYAGLIGVTLRFPWVTVVVAAAILAGSYYLFDNYVTRNTIWSQFGAERSTIDIAIRQPSGTYLEDTDELVRYFEERLAQMPEIEDYVSSVSATNASINITFPPEIASTMIPVVTHEQLYAFSLQFGGTDVRVTGPAHLYYGGSGGSPNYRIRVFGYNYEKVREIAEDIGSRLAQFTRVRDVDTNTTGSYSSDRTTYIAVVLDRDRLALYEISAQDLVSRISAAIRETPGTATVRIGGEELSLRVTFAGSRELDVSELEDVMVPLANGGAVRLGDVATLEERRVLSNIRRENQQYERTIAYEFRGPPQLGNAVRDVVLNATALPPGYRIEAQQSLTISREEQRQIWGVLAFSIVLIFMVTAAFFESIRQPLCVLLAVPMALVGVFLLFFYLGAQFNREAYIGVIMMGGIVVNNAILLVARFNYLRRVEGVPMNEALVQGTLDRVRPILMTSATTVIGLLPLVLFSENVDFNIWNALAYTLMGGLISSTLFTLTVTPALYLLFERRAERRRLAAAGGAAGSSALGGPGVAPAPVA
ncbi:MAG TPA: efflux RND transporter permease subunit [Longimicrobiales bacterium]|nr:efflux RND transporter permease subunit [Longimicrobiales bacterium]